MPGKRKRGASNSEPEAEAPLTNGVDKQRQELNAWMKDALFILRRFDTTPSILERKLETNLAPNSSLENAAEANKSSYSSISDAVQREAYNALEKLSRDFDMAKRSLLEELRDKVKSGDVQSTLVQKVKSQLYSLDHQLRSLITGEMIQRPGALVHHEDDAEEQHEKKHRDIDTSLRGSNKTVLTLYGGERSQKQLFSGLAKPRLGSIPFGDKPLPNGISTTQIIPVHSLEDERQKAPTIGQRFQPPSSIKPLDPPKQASKHTSTRSSSINWYNPVEASAAAKENVSRDTYPKQSLSTGRWLTYNVAPSSEQLTSPGSKRRHRERALSTGEPQSAVPEEVSAAHSQAKEDALFRSVYSSFAPNHDDFGAVVTREQKNRMWWSKYGEAQYEELLDARDEAAYDLNGSSDDSDIPEEQIDERLVEEAISNWVPSGTVGEGMLKQNAKNDSKAKDADELLGEISELLEILNSHQRLRNLSQPGNSRALQGQKEQLASLPTSPTSPSAAEFDVYEDLKSHLVDVISTLPPYMLAKLDSNKLGPLLLSTKIKIPGKNQKGTVEEDGLPAKAKTAAAAPYPAAYNAAANIRSGYASTPTSQQYSRPPYTQPAVKRQPPVAGTYSTSQYANRPASASQYTGGIGGTPRPAYGGQYTQHRTTSSTFVDRYANGQYGHQQSPHSYGQYPNNYRPTLAQHSSYGQQYSTPQARVPPASNPAPQAYRASQSEYHSRSAAPPSYNYSAAQAGNNMSPNMNQAASYPSQQRSQVYHQHSSHYGSQSPVPQTNGASTKNGTSQMSPIDQAALIARQKQQIAEAQAQARQASGTPQPATGQSTQQNGTPVPQQNGVTA